MFACVHIDVRVGGTLRRAALVVAADGVHSRIRQQLGLNTRLRRKRFAVCAHFRLAGNREQPRWVDVFVERRHELYVTPPPEREIVVAALVDAGPLDEPVEGAFQRWYDSQPALARRLDGAKQTSALLTTAPLATRASVGVAPGVVLLGDAAGSADPITGGGIMLALKTAELLAAHMVAGLGTGDQWLWEFDRERRTLLRDCEIVTCMALWLSDHPRLAQNALRELSRFPGTFSHLVGVSGGVRRLFGLGNSPAWTDVLAAPGRPMKQIISIGEILSRLSP